MSDDAKAGTSERTEDATTTSVLFVCLGNICRSPTAEGVFARKVEEADLSNRIRIDSAGTGAWHVGRPPDARAQEAARARGIDIGDLRGRQVEPTDMLRFDHVIAMDGANLRELRRLRDEAVRAYGGDAVRAQLHTMLSFDPNRADSDVPDPYAGGPEGFEQVLDMIDDAAEGLLGQLRSRLA